jgi:chromosome segregation ATPase
MKLLEGELHRLIAAVDARLSAMQSHRQPMTSTNSAVPLLDQIKAFDRRHLAAFAGLTLLLFTTGWAGSSLFYGSRLKYQIEDELRPYASELAETVTTIQTDLAPRMAAADDLKAEIDRARRDLLTRDEEVETTITEAQAQLLNVRDTAIDDIERRLSDQTDDLGAMLDNFRQRAVDIDKGLIEISQALAAFDHQLPVLTDGLGKVAQGLVENREKLERVAEGVEILDGNAPPLLQSIDTHRLALDDGTKTLNILQAQLEALKSQTSRSSQQLDQVLAEGRSRITNWEGVDRDIEERKEDILRNLDHYADTLNSRVREFIEAINLEPTYTGG